MKRYLPLLRYLSAATCLSILVAFAQQAPAPETHGIVVANLDRSVKPGDDFYRFANGDWIKRTQIPPDRAAVDVFTKLADLSNKRTNDLINEIAKSNAAAPNSKHSCGSSGKSKMCLVSPCEAYAQARISACCVRVGIPVEGPPR